jgi:hypothetical protein
VDKGKADNPPQDAYIYMGCFHCEKPSA